MPGLYEHDLLEWSEPVRAACPFTLDELLATPPDA